MKRSQYDHAINKYRYRFFDERFKNMAVQRGEGGFLLKIFRSGGQMLMNDLTDQLFFHKSHTTRSINKLVDEGLITKTKNPDDLRGYILTVTDKGKEVAKHIEAVHLEWENLINTVITDEERNVLQNLTKKIYHLLRNYYNEEDTINEDSI